MINSSGNILVAKKLDRETKNAYELTITAQDRAGTLIKQMESHYEYNNNKKINYTDKYFWGECCKIKSQVATKPIINHRI